MEMAIAYSYLKVGMAALSIGYIFQDLLSRFVIVCPSKLHVKLNHFVLARDKYTPSSLDMDDFDSGKLAVGLEGQLQVSIYKQLVETFGIECVSHIVHLNFDGGSAAAGRRRVDVAKDTSCTEDDLTRACKLHNGDFLADSPEHLGRNAKLGLGVVAEN